jgi:hypothetical protein
MTGDGREVVQREGGTEGQDQKPEEKVSLREM